MNPLHIVSVIGVIRYQDTFLLVKRSSSDEIFPGKWQNVGGKIESGETVEKALEREIQEELGFTLEPGTKPIFLKSYSWTKDPNEPKRLGLIFLIELSKQPTITLCDELDHYQWCSIAEAEKLETIGFTSPTGTLAQLRAVDSR